MPSFSKYNMPAIIAAVCGGVLVMVPQVQAQQSSPAKNSSSAPGSLAPLSNGTPQLGKYAAPAKGSKLEFSHSSVALIPGSYKDGHWTAGVEIFLKPGWKTYWRVPGDAGVPPEFVWDKSVNVKDVKVLWPAPHRYEDVTGKSIGYKKHVVFPLKVTSKASGTPARLDLRLYYAICSDICVPAQANVALDLPAVEHLPTNEANLQRIKTFADTVPETNAEGLDVVRTQAKMVAGKPVLSVVLKGKVKDNTDILVEGFDAAFFEAPQRQPDNAGQAVFHLPIDGIDKVSELSGTALKLTILSGPARLETQVKLK